MLFSKIALEMFRKRSNSNKLSKIIKAARKSYLSKQFELNRDNIKHTWKLIGSLIDRRNTNSQIPIKKILYISKFSAQTIAFLAF